ncbi:unnamed protein product [Phaedon cochleariae]|uniref:Clusterin-associated protein 1 n=1 Tax=Phaedon cochleariae TaxID=80249 RepID=A0A9P0DCI2_PHACE|nr:unnamed protein product [Phaedon cochleariae]
MSYRDIRNLVETLRVLGYPNMVSMESFRSSNFPLVADLLVWLAKRFDPEADIPPEISTEDERVKLMRNVAQFMALKANIKLNTKRLYQADGYAIKELLKITSILHDALLSNLDQNEDERNEEASLDMREFDITDKVNELKFSRQLASEITSTGANLFDLLGKEVDLKAARQKSVSRQFELSDVESGIKDALQSIKKEIDETKHLIENVAATEASLDSKIERRNLEISRYEKRLQALKKVRPAFLEEFTALEKELEQLFVQYSLRLRCLVQLEKQFEDSESARLEKQLQLAALPPVQTIPLDQTDHHDDVFMEKVGGDRPGATNRHHDRQRVPTGGRSKIEKAPAKAYGGMQPPLLGSQSSLDLSTDSESDDSFLDKDEPELMHSDESLGPEVSADRRAPSARVAASKMQDNSDDDF